MDVYALTSVDVPDLEAYLHSLHPANAVYFLERMTQYGVNSPWGRFFGVRGLQNTLIGIVMFDRNEGECRLYWTNREAMPLFARLIESRPTEFSYIVGQFSQVEPIVDLLTPASMAISRCQSGRMYQLPPDNFRVHENQPVRRATPADAEETLALDPMEPTASQAQLQARRARLDRYTAYVAEADGRIVSWAGTALQYGPGANITAVETDPKYQRQGYCSSCMTALCRELLQQVSHIYLSVADENESAIHVYQKLGFVPLGEEVNPRRLVKMRNSD